MLPAGDPRWRRVLLKVSGEAFRTGGLDPVDAPGLSALVAEIAEAADLGVQIAIVNGGGNIVRGAQTTAGGLGRTTADTMGMLATVINALALQELLERRGLGTRVMTSIEMKAVAEPYIRRRCVRHLEKGRIVILAGGTGNPYFSTDTAAALRGVEISAEVLLKGTQVDGVYDADPRQREDARRFEHLGYEEVLQRRLEVMDRTAFTLCEANHLPIVVFRMGEEGNLGRLLRGDALGTYIGDARRPGTS